MSEITPALYKAIFEDDRRGAAILSYLERRYAKPMVTSGGIDAVLETYRRMGQREVIEFIALMINRANGVPDDNADQGE